MKSVGAIMGAAGVSTVTVSTAAAAKSQRTDANGLTTRKRKYKYPWWVKQVEKITTEIDEEAFGQPFPLHYIAYHIMFRSQEEKDELNGLAKEHVYDGIVNNVPGRTLPDLALHYAETTYFGGMGSFDAPDIIDTPGSDEILEYNMHPPQDFGLEPWQATPEEASKVVEAAGIQLGAAMVGIAKLDHRWLYANYKIDPTVENEVKDGGVTKIPERFKYVVTVISQGPRDLLIRAQSELGAAGDRNAYANAWISANRLQRFIRGLGHNTTAAQSKMPVIAPAIASGLGELGRMNRMINPIYGGNVRIQSFLTDLPLMPDSPIDFGLQEFCKTCKKCATECPSGAISMADEPTWIPFNQFQNGGKKTYFEDNERCGEYVVRHGNFCNTCMSVCPWSKQDKTALHDIVRTLGSKAPGASNLYVNLDDAFGYGPVELDSPEMAEWWDLDIPQFGLDSYQGKE